MECIERVYARSITKQDLQANNVIVQPLISNAYFSFFYTVFCHFLAFNIAVYYYVGRLQAQRSQYYYRDCTKYIYNVTKHM